MSFAGSRSRSAGRMPAPRAVPPEWASNLREPVAHADSPLRQMQVAMVPPAEQHSVIRVRGAAVGVFSHMVDLTPACRSGAAGDDAPTIAERDRATLKRIEDAGGRAERCDATVVVEEDPLDAARTPGLLSHP